MGTATTNVDGAGPATSAAPRTVTVSGQSAAHSVVYSGADAVGNASGNTTVNFGIDLTNPTVAGGVTSASIPGTPANIDVTWTAATDGLSGVAGYTVRWVQAAACPAATPANYPNSVAVGNVTTYNITPLTKNAMYCAYVVAVDNAGNQSAASAVTGPTKAK
jgi:chitin-binding protein